MRRDQFSLHRRGGIWYVQFYNQHTHRYLTARSTGESNRNAALLKVAAWMRDGLPDASRGSRQLRELLDLDLAISIIRSAPLTPDDAGRIVKALKDRDLIRDATVGAGAVSEPLITFLERFWDHDQSSYVRERLAHGQRISRRHCREASNRLEYYWKPYFGEDKTLSAIRKSDINTFSLWLKQDKGLMANTVNNVLSVGTVAFRWAARNDVISKNPAEGLMGFSGKHMKRGILTDSEVEKLFALPWSDKHSKLANMLAMSTGLRAGEILALQVRDIGDDRLNIRHSWNKWDTLKGTKTDKERTVPIIPSIRTSLLDLARSNPNEAGPSTFVFWSASNPERPMDPDRLIDGLRAALLRLKVSESEMKDKSKVKAAKEYWKRRLVVFHSWRHYFAARMADRLEKRKVMLATGHSDGAVFDAYADHSNETVFHEVERAATDVFGKLLHFPALAPQDSRNE
jgi:integrase